MAADNQIELKRAVFSSMHSCGFSVLVTFFFLSVNLISERCFPQC